MINALSLRLRIFNLDAVSLQLVQAAVVQVDSNLPPILDSINIVPSDIVHFDGAIDEVYHLCLRAVITSFNLLFCRFVFGAEFGNQTRFIAISGVIWLTQIWFCCYI